MILIFNFLIFEELNENDFPDDGILLFIFKQVHNTIQNGGLNATEKPDKSEINAMHLHKR
jgi:hypothetical protein